MGRQSEDVLVPELPALRRVGHKGADLIVPGNTLKKLQTIMGFTQVLSFARLFTGGF